MPEQYSKLVSALNNVKRTLRSSASPEKVRNQTIAALQTTAPGTAELTPSEFNSIVSAGASLVFSALNTGTDITTDQIEGIEPVLPNDYVRQQTMNELDIEDENYLSLKKQRSQAIAVIKKVRSALNDDLSNSYATDKAVSDEMLKIRGTLEEDQYQVMKGIVNSVLLRQAAKNSGDLPSVDVIKTISNLTSPSTIYNEGDSNE